MHYLLSTERLAANSAVHFPPEQQYVFLRFDLKSHWTPYQFLGEACYDRTIIT
jgi:hypothetical protein